MYINFWYPMIRSEDLGPDKPERAKVLGLNFAIFRDSKGKAHVLSDTCTHRGGSLGGAWELGKNPRIQGDCVVCPYHGWEFNGEGECANIPSIGYGAKVPARAKVDAYPTVEKYGIVFAFLGDLPENERPPLLDIAEDDALLLRAWQRRAGPLPERVGVPLRYRHVAVDEEAPASFACEIVHVTTLEQLVLGLRPFWGTESAPLHYASVRAAPRHWIKALPGLLRGRPNRYITPANGYESRNAHRLLLGLDSHFFVDGEIYSPTAGSPLVFSAGGSAGFIQLR